MIKISLSLSGTTIKKALPGNHASIGRRGMNCDDWPDDMSLLELKALLRSEVYTNIGLDCNTTHSKGVCFMCFCQLGLYIPCTSTNIHLSISVHQRELYL